MSDGLAVYIEIIDEMDLSSLVDGNLVAGTDAQTGVVARTVIHETFASGRVGLLIERAGNRQPGGDACLEVVLIQKRGSIDVDSGGVCPRRNIGTSGGRDAVLDVGASE